MKEKDKICNYCKKAVEKQVYDVPTWFGWYSNGKLIAVICKDCYPDHKEEWRKGEF